MKRRKGRKIKSLGYRFKHSDYINRGNGNKKANYTLGFYVHNKQNEQTLKLTIYELNNNNSTQIENDLLLDFLHELGSYPIAQGSSGKAYPIK